MTATFPAARERPTLEPNPSGKRLGLLSLTALGVVFGDIGTSPLYAMKQCFRVEAGGPAGASVPPTPDNVFGVLSLIVWALTMVVTVKYIFFIMRADNDGEGGILALLALIQQRLHRDNDSVRLMVLGALGLFGAALLYGDGVITPAVSVLGAVEGIDVATPALRHLVVPISVVVLFILFLFQRGGTTKIGRVFGPVMLLWFGTIALFGALEIAKEPSILKAVNPWYAVQFFVNHGWHGIFILGSVVLAVTGAEALYADMGHFGRLPIRLAWAVYVFPSLLLNYFGQGALLQRDPTASFNPFYRLIPGDLIWPMLVLATAAAVIASQALISGAFSLTHQAMQLGYSPRLTVTHTSKLEAGQIFIPQVNRALMVGSIALVIFFKSSSALASAYGIAVTGTMVITTILFTQIARRHWGWSRFKASVFLAVFLTIDGAFLIANVIKIESGGWFPLAAALGVYLMMTTWNHGRRALHTLLREGSLPISLFLDDVKRRQPPRVPGTAVFMTSDESGAPVVLLHHLKHNKVLHDQVILLSVVTDDVPEVPAQDRVNVEPLGEGFYRVIARYGFMQQPNVPSIFPQCAPLGVKLRPADTSYFLGREQLIPTGRSKMSRWRKKLFVIMSRNAQSATQFFGLPPNRVVELGAQIEF
ncbi:MAG: Low affinity potassium transport system protein kup [Gemmatimonadetes bacterium]|nr:Low affinity potassium transport system protein kup [Gemmatimonadota bacterium]